VTINSCDELISYVAKLNHIPINFAIKIKS